MLLGCFADDTTCVADNHTSVLLVSCHAVHNPDNTAHTTEEFECGCRRADG